MYRFPGHAGGGHPFLHVLVLVLLLLIVAATAILLYRLLARRQVAATPIAPAQGAAGAALEIVQLRYARGEIKRAEYLRMRADFGAPAEADEAPTVADEPAAPSG